MTREKCEAKQSGFVLTHNPEITWRYYEKPADVLTKFEPGTSQL
jgi:hypothetical protein